jgi:enoyl-CoA hydratase/carnithine racemase
VQWAVPRAVIGNEAVQLARSIAALPPPALRVAKQLIAAAGASSTTGYALERELGGALLETPEARARITAFLQRSARPAPTPSPGTLETDS